MEARRAKCQDAGSPLRSPTCRAVVESFFATLEWELIERSDWPVRDEARASIFEDIEAWYNQQCRQRC